MGIKFWKKIGFEEQWKRMKYKEVLSDGIVGKCIDNILLV